MRTLVGLRKAPIGSVIPPGTAHSSPNSCCAWFDLETNFDDLSKEKLIPNPLDRRTERTLQRIIRQLERGQRLNEKYIIDPKNYIIDKSDVSMLTPPLSNQVLSAQPSEQVIQTASVAPIDESGLTAVEKALYDESEKQMTLRNRGLLT